MIKLYEIKRRPLIASDYPVLVFRPELSADKGRGWEFWEKPSTFDKYALAESGMAVFRLPGEPK